MAQAFKNKPQTTEELLSSALKQKPAETKTTDEFSDASQKPEEKSVDDILANAFASAPTEIKSTVNTHDDALMQAFSTQKEEIKADVSEKSKAESKYDPEFEALLRAFKS